MDTDPGRTIARKTCRGYWISGQAELPEGVWAQDLEPITRQTSDARTRHARLEPPGSDRNLTRRMLARDRDLGAGRSAPAGLRIRLAAGDRRSYAAGPFARPTDRARHGDPCAEAPRETRPPHRGDR